jgi:sugar-specific transcriptional regulator TrmB
MNYNQIKEALESYGLTQTEIKLYIFLLSHGKASAGQVAKETQSDRSSCYETLKKLEKKGMIRQTIAEKTKYFEVNNPEILLGLLKDKEEKMNSVIKDMKEIYYSNKTESNVQIYKGYNGLKAIFLDILREGKDYCVLDSSGQFVKKMPYFSAQFIQMLEKKKIKVKHIVRKGIDISPSKTTEVRYFSKKIPLCSGNTTIYGDKVAIFIWKENPEVIAIRDKPTAQLYRDYFEILWSHAKKK